MLNTDGAGLSRMKGKVLPIIQLSCLRTGEGLVSTHLGEPMAGDGRVVDLDNSVRCHGN
ncbi:hypothetical protein Hanom_Chr09g00864551 [Helianthus anomalus]